MISYEHSAPTAPMREGGAIRRVAAYCRVSTLQEEQELSYETQCAYYKRLIRADPTMTLAGIYGDQGGSGLSLQRRPAFQRMLHDCWAGKIDLILTKSVSRFARNLADCVSCVRLLRERGIPVLFEKEGVNSADPSSEMVLSVLASLAQEESRGLSESICWSLERQNASGTPSRAARYGYRKHKDAKGQTAWRIYEPEAEQVRLAFRLAAQGERVRAILAALNAAERMAGARARWSCARLRALLQSEVYVGDILTNQYYTPDYLARKFAKNEGQKPQYYIEGHHQPIIDRETFARAGALLRQSKLHLMNRGGTHVYDNDSRKVADSVGDCV